MAALDEAGNASSVHQAGRRVRRLVEGAREAVADAIGVQPGAVVVTSGGSEANTWALAGFEGPKVVSAIEHDSVLAAAADAHRAPVGTDGRLDLDAFGGLLDRVRPSLVSLMLANNETGVIQPVAEAAMLARAAGACVHCDGVQALGKLDVDVEALGVDLLTLSAHKLGGPMGVGALIVRDGLDLQPMIRGGGQERRRRAGTENLPGIAGFGQACRSVAGDPTERNRIRRLRDSLEAGVREIAPEVRIIGQEGPRLPNTSALVMPGVSHETQLIAFDLAGVLVSTGSACSSGKVGPSHVLTAMGVPRAEAGAAIRVSLGWSNTEADVARFLDAWGELYRRTGSRLAEGPPRLRRSLANLGAATT
jgi:cysteine desulfurase